MNEGYYVSFNEFLRLNRLLWNDDVPNKLKCGQCKLILIDANQIRCGCSFCKTCIDEMIENGTKKCPGNSDTCSRKMLSESSPNVKVNTKIMKLMLKCPANRCGYECELGSMQEHLRLCEMKSARCPFYYFGCSLNNVAKDKMNDHLQSEEYNHNMILIDTIENLKNEVKRLEENSQINEETIAAIHDEIRLIKMEKQQMTTEINDLKEKSKNEMVKLGEEMRKNCRDNLCREINKINNEMHKWQSQMTSRFGELKDLHEIPFEAIFSWRVDQLLDKRRNATNIFSEIFYPRNNPYKMQLGMWNHADSDELNVWLIIYAGEYDEHLEWPVQRNITIQITNNTRPDTFKRITNYCDISQPTNNSYKWDGPSEFSYLELSSAGLMHDNHFTIEFGFE